VRQLLLQAGLDPDRAVKEWERLGWTISGYKGQPLRQVRVAGGRMWLLALRRGAIEGLASSTLADGTAGRATWQMPQRLTTALSCSHDR
jgi:hypothetical protein